MPRGTWSAKRERQFEHVEDSLRSRGKSPAVAKEIAARTVNTVPAQQGEAAQASRSSTQDLSPSRRGGLRSHVGERGRTLEQLRQEAKAKKIPGRSRMRKAELERALGR